MYLIGGYFLHREAFHGCMYETQTYTKKWRNIERIYGAYFDQDKYFSEINSKHFKKYYNGKPTKRYLKLLSKIKQVENVDYREIELMMINQILFLKLSNSFTSSTKSISNAGVKISRHQ